MWLPNSNLVVNTLMVQNKNCGLVLYFFDVFKNIEWWRIQLCKPYKTSCLFSTLTVNDSFDSPFFPSSGVKSWRSSVVQNLPDDFTQLINVFGSMTYVLFFESLLFFSELDLNYRLKCYVPPLSSKRDGTA